MLFLDEAFDRHTARAQAKFESMVSAVRAGTIFAHDGKQHAKWVRQTGRAAGRQGLTGDALEAAVRGIAAMFPGHVERVTA